MRARAAASVRGVVWGGGGGAWPMIDCIGMGKEHGRARAKGSQFRRGGRVGGERMDDEEESSLLARSRPANGTPTHEPKVEADLNP